MIANTTNHTLVGQRSWKIERLFRGESPETSSIRF